MKGSNTTRKGVLTYRPGISRVPAKGHHVVQSLSLGCHVIRCAREQRVWDGVRQLSFVHQERGRLAVKPASAAAPARSPSGRVCMVLLPSERTSRTVAGRVRLPCVGTACPDFLLRPARGRQHSRSLLGWRLRLHIAGHPVWRAVAGRGIRCGKR